jgi:hypothetical protein
MQAQAGVRNQFINSIAQGDGIQVMDKMPANSVEFILTPSAVSRELPRPRWAHDPERCERGLAQACDTRSLSRHICWRRVDRRCRTSAGGRDGHALQQQQAASDTVAGRGVGSSDSQLHVAG